MLGVLAVLIGLVTLYYFLRRPNHKLPPGPRGLPLIGNLHQIDHRRPQDTINQWTKEYGGIYHFRQLTDVTIVLSTHDLIYEALVTRSNDFAGRPRQYRARVILNFAEDIGSSDFTPKWIYTKKLTMQALKMYGDGLANLEEISMDVIKDMMTELEQGARDGTPVDMKSCIHKCAGCILSSVIWGERMDDTEVDRVLSLERQLMELVQPAGRGSELELFPPLRYIPSIAVKELDLLRRAFQEVISGKNKAIATHHASEPTCVMEAILQQLDREKKETGKSPLTDGEVTAIAINLISAGTVTTSTTMYCLIAVLIHKPELQQKITDEIHTTIGDRPPRLSDRTSLPYTEAAILETLRYSSIVSLSLPHKATIDTQLGGFDIPRGTTILMNLWDLHHNEEYWDDPWEFRPERFLTEDGTLVPPGDLTRKRLLAFGAGRRVCPGEVLARNRLFLLVTSLLQRFHFKAEADDKLPVFDPREYEVGGVVLTPPRYKVRLTPATD